MLNIFICEDDSQQRERLVDMIKLHGAFKEYSLSFKIISDSPEKFLEAYQAQASITNIYFFDIEFSGKVSGFELGQSIRKIDHLGHVVYLTAYEQYMPLAFKYFISPLNYIIKSDPIILQERLGQTLDHAVFLNQKVSMGPNEIKESLFTFTSKGTLRSISVNSIYYFEHLANHLISINLENKVVTFHSSLRQIEKKCPSLLRISQSVIINPDKIKFYDPHSFFVFLTNGYSSKVGRSYRNRLKRVLASLTWNT